jgi:hypothetical protein
MVEMVIVVEVVAGIVSVRVDESRRNTSADSRSGCGGRCCSSSS